jgi:transposase
MMRPDAKVQKVYLYPKPVDFRKSINGLAALVELDIKVEVFNPVLFVFLNRTCSQVKILYWERNGFCLSLKRLEAERFKTKPDAEAEAEAEAEEIVAPVKRRGKRKPLPANLPRVEVIHDLPEHELTSDPVFL